VSLGRFASEGERKGRREKKRFDEFGRISFEF
jgi:hypothetical protein